LAKSKPGNSNVSGWPKYCNKGLYLPIKPYLSRRRKLREHFRIVGSSGEALICRLAPIEELAYSDHMEDFYSKYPHRVGAGTERSGSGFSLKRGYFALHRTDATQAGELVFDNGRIAVVKGEPSQTRELQSSIGPVYELGPGGSLAVPTGSVFIRFLDGVDAASRKQDIERAGYALQESLPYASNAAWLKANSGSIADSLTGLSRLVALPDVENVEPQMLMKGSTRND
jgi:hypothetical protein